MFLRGSKATLMVGAVWSFSGRKSASAARGSNEARRMRNIWLRHMASRAGQIINDMPLT